MPKLNRQIILLGALLLMNGAVKAAPSAASTAAAEDVRAFLPAGFYRKISGDKVKCPPGHFVWVENNQMLTIGAAEPVLFHSFNATESRDIPFKAFKCTAETTNQVKDTSKPKQPARMVAQVIKTHCGEMSNTSNYTLSAAKTKTKTTVNLTIQVTHESPKHEVGPVISCSYEISP